MNSKRSSSQQIDTSVSPRAVPPSPIHPPLSKEHSPYVTRPPRRPTPDSATAPPGVLLSLHRTHKIPLLLRIEIWRCPEAAALILVVLNCWLNADTIFQLTRSEGESTLS